MYMYTVQYTDVLYVHTEVWEQAFTFLRTSYSS